MFQQRADDLQYPKTKVLWWLHRLAKQLVQEGQTVFLIEYMQPQSWLFKTAERWQYRLILGLILGLTEAFSKTIQERNQPNQGIINSVKNSIIVVIFSLVLMPFIYFMLPSMVSGILDPESVESLVTALLPVPILLGFMSGGGLAIVGHLALRTTLYLNGHAPRNFAHFLNYAEQRLFVQRVGGGYTFVHRLLLEHFAGLELVKPAR